MAQFQFALFISERVSPLIGSLGFTGRTRSDPNHMGRAQKKTIRGGDPTQILSFGSGVTAWWKLCSVEQKTPSVEKLFDPPMRKGTWVWSGAAQTLLSKAVCLCAGFVSVWPSWTGPPPISVLLVFAQQAGWLLACGPLLPPPPPRRPGPSSHCWRKTRPECQSLSAVFGPCEKICQRLFYGKMNP